MFGTNNSNLFFGQWITTKTNEKKLIIEEAEDSKERKKHWNEQRQPARFAVVSFLRHGCVFDCRNNRLSIGVLVDCGETVSTYTQYPLYAVQCVHTIHFAFGQFHFNEHIARSHAWRQPDECSQREEKKTVQAQWNTLNWKWLLM